MSAVGIDFGNENCYVAVAKAGGIETITNDYSQRATPSYVAFGPTCRDLGTSAKNKFITNLKSTICSFKRLIGKKFRDPTLQYELSYLPFTVHELPNGSVGVKVSYLGNEAIFTVPQIAAMLMTKLKDITETALASKVTDCVVSVPIFFTDADRRAMLDVCKIAGLNVLRLLNETAAVALAYGFYRQDLLDDKPKKVVFVDIGHSSVQASLCDMYRSKLEVLHSTWDYCLGGRDIDNCMVRYFSQEFKAKYNLDVLSNNRAIVRLLQECEKLKKQLSANPQVLPLSIECFMEDKDVCSSLGREKLEELCTNLLLRIEAVFRKLLKESKVHLNEIFAIELVGGTTRMPAVKNIIKRVFGKEPSTTLNLDEAVARGCALQAAMLSPTVKVKEYGITDVQPFSIKLAWNISKNERGDLEVFPSNHPVPFSKLLTFFIREDLTLDTYYSGGKERSGPDVLIGCFTVKYNGQAPTAESVKIVVKIRININGIFSVRSAVIVDKDFKENMTLDQKNEDLLDVKIKTVDSPQDTVLNEEKRRDFFSLKKHKKILQGVELQIMPKVPQLSESELKTFFDTEQRMIHQDRCEERRINAKNSVEEYVYEMRDHLSNQLKPYTDEQESNDFRHKLGYVENWIYEDGENQNEAVYKEKLSELKSMAEPILRRKYECEHRTPAIEEFHNLISEAQNILSSYLSPDSPYSHIDPRDMEMVQKLVDEKLKWLQQQMESLKELKTHENPPILTEHINAEKEKLKQAIYPIFNKRKPKAENPNTKCQKPQSSNNC